MCFPKNEAHLNKTAYLEFMIKYHCTLFYVEEKFHVCAIEMHNNSLFK